MKKERYLFGSESPLNEKGFRLMKKDVVGGKGYELIIQRGPNSFDYFFIGEEGYLDKLDQTRDEIVNIYNLLEEGDRNYTDPIWNEEEGVKE